MKTWDATDAIRPTMPGPIHSGGFEMVQAAPSAVLNGIVTRITGYAERTHGHFRQHEAASLTVPLVISFGDTFAIGLGGAPADNDRFGSFTAGLYAGPVVIDSFGSASCVQIDLTPFGARRVFGLPMHELANRMVSLDDALGGDGHGLREKLGNAGNWHDRFAIALGFVESRAVASDAVSAATAWAFSRLLASGGGVPVAALADRVGWSRKHLASRFRDEIGLGPKAVARIVRMNRALDRAKSGDGGWADIAADCGYADQAHLTREFASLVGATPSEWRSRLS